MKKLIRVEAIPYKSLDEQMELALKLDKEKRQNKFKSFHDLGNCFIIEHFNASKDIWM